MIQREERKEVLKDILNYPPGNGYRWAVGLDLETEDLSEETLDKQG